jgi:hypothetical protein
LLLEELTRLLDESGLQDIKNHFYKHEFGLEQVLKGSFPNPGDAERIRKLFVKDLGVNRLGLGACRTDGRIYFTYPVVALVGHKPSRE